MLSTLCFVDRFYCWVSFIAGWKGRVLEIGPDGGGNVCVGELKETD